MASVETHLAWRCLNSLSPKSAPSEQEFRRERPPVRLDAIENYIRGLLAASPEQKHRLFTQAVRLDPRFSEPSFQLGKMAWQKKDYSLASGWLEKVNRTDSHFFEALFLLGLCGYYTADFASAEKNLLIVAASVPLNEVWNDLGAVQLRLRSPSALDNFRRALDGDSTDPDYHFNLGYALFVAFFPKLVAGPLTRFQSTVDQFPQARVDADDVSVGIATWKSEAVLFLGRCLKKDVPRAGDPRSEGRERLKLNFEETAYRQLKAELESKH